MTVVHEPDTPCADGTVDHDLEVTFEDDEMIQGFCKNCGTEIDHDKQPEGFGDDRQ